MLEKRQDIRYRVGKGADIVIFREGGNLVAPLVDLSSRGLMAALPESECRRLAPGREVRGQLRRAGSVMAWRGTVVHRSAARSSVGVGVGIAFHQDGEILAAVEDIVRQPDAGGLQLQRRENGLALEVHGQFSFLVSRDALAYIRRDIIECVDLCHCHGIDSAGLGTLNLARERQIAIVGAQGAVKKLLAIARLIEPEAAATESRRGIH